MPHNRVPLSVLPLPVPPTHGPSTYILTTYVPNTQCPLSVSTYQCPSSHGSYSCKRTLRKWAAHTNNIIGFVAYILATNRIAWLYSSMRIDQLDRKDYSILKLLILTHITLYTYKHHVMYLLNVTHCVKNCFNSRTNSLNFKQVFCVLKISK